MTDPAIAAAQRAWAERYGEDQLGRFNEDCAEDENVAAFVTAAAREALASLRELHRPFVRPASYYGRSKTITVCNHCYGPQDWPCATARLIYAEVEL